MNCQKCKIEIEDRDPRRESVSGAAQAHLSACASCRAFAGERLALRRLVGGLEKVSAPADFDFRMRARMAAEQGAGSAPRAGRFNFSPASLSWPLAACLALVVSASLYFQPRRPHTTPATPAAEQAHAAMPSPQTPVDEATPLRDYPAGDDIRPNVSPNRPTRPGVETVAAKISPERERRRTVVSRGTGRTGIVRELAQVEDSTSTSLMGATPRVASSGATRSEGASIPVPLDAPEGQLKVLLRDTSGGARTISVDSVSFGSRDVMGRPGATYTRASLSSNQGVW
ncbi:MAG TPA: hypothetical protein VEZ40_15855 [Pyrinomonadaceae bacterium]|nr:hypothetical protein [Pyrinomonadaceae bacterium]